MEKNTLSEDYSSIAQTPHLLQEFLESYELLEKMAEIAQIGAWKVEVATNRSIWTKQLFAIYELDSTTPLQFEEIIQLELPSYRPIHRQCVRNLMEQGKTFDIEVETLTVKGNHRWLRIIGKGLFDAEGKITHRIGITQDITGKKKLEQNALENLRRYQTLFEGISDAVLLTDDETGRISEVNTRALHLYEFSREELLGKEFLSLCADSESPLQLQKDRQSYVPLQWHRKKNGARFPVELTSNCLQLQGTCTHIVVARDITARIEAEQKIRSLLQEKDLLLKEVHHRIKNHMQTVTSLLQLQANASEDPYVIETLEEANNKLKSLGILYDKLYRTHQIQHLSLKEYLPSLVKELIHTFPRKVLLSLEIDVEDILLPVNQLSYVGILVNELVTNALKYAFLGRTEGRIRVSAKQVDPILPKNLSEHTDEVHYKNKAHHINEDHYQNEAHYQANGNLPERAASEDWVTLIVEDDGIGIPETVDLKDPSSFGLQLIQALVQQLGGSLQIYRQNGTKFEVLFRKLPVTGS